MRLLAIAVVVLLSGCASAPVEETGCEGEACEVVLVIPDAPDAEVDPVYDRIQGVVIDNIYAPIAGAKVVVSEGGKRLAEAVTGKDGEFAFLRVPDRSYRLDVSHEAYLDARALVLPMAIPQHIIIPMEKGIVQPRATLSQWDGVLRCGAFAVSQITDVACIPVDFMMGTSNDDTRLFHEEIVVPGPPAVQAQMEVVWTPGMDQSKALQLQLYAQNMENNRRTSVSVGHGESPLVVAIGDGDIATHYIGAPGQRTAGIYASMASAGTDGMPVGLALDQKFTAFLSMMYKEPAPEGWTYVRDGPL